MRPYDLHFFPYPPLYLLAFLLLLGFLLVLLRWGLIRYVYERLGLSRRAGPDLRDPRRRPIMRCRRHAGAR